MSKPSVSRSKSRSPVIDLATGRALENRRSEAETRVLKAERAFAKASAAAKTREEDLANARRDLEAVNSEVNAFVKANTAALLSHDRAFQLLLESGEDDATLPL